MAENLKEFRRKLKLSQKDVAECTGFAVSKISRIENLLMEPKQHELNIIIEVLMRLEKVLPKREVKPVARNGKLGRPMLPRIKCTCGRTASTKVGLCNSCYTTELRRKDPKKYNAMARNRYKQKRIDTDVCVPEGA